MTLSVRAYTTLALGGAVGFACLLGLLFAVLAAREAVFQALRRHYQGQAELVGALAPVALSPDGPRLLEPAGRAAAGLPGVRYAYLADPEGRLLFHTDPAFVGRTVLAWRSSPYASGTEEFSRSVLLEEGSATARLGVDKDLYRDLFRETGRKLTPGFLTVALLIVASAVLLAWALSLFVADPVARLAEGARRVGSGDLSVRLPTEGPAEVAELGSRFNEMVGRLQALDELKGALMSHVSHDVRSPMAAVQMLADSLLEEGSALTDKQRRKLTIIREQTQRLRLFAANVLDAARIKEGRLVLRRETVDVSKAVDRVIRLFAFPAEEEGIQLSARVQGGLTAQGDPDRFEQAVANLVSNSLKFTDAGGSVSIDGFSKGARTVVRVVDAGRGMSDEQRRLAFEPFRPGNDSPGGVGLGLIVVRRSIEGMGGSVLLESEPGRGTSVTLELPA